MGTVHQLPLRGLRFPRRQGCSEANPDPSSICIPALRRTSCSRISSRTWTSTSGRRRAVTPRQTATTRSTSCGSVRRINAGYDGQIGGKKFIVQYLTSRGAQGRCRFLEHGTGVWLGDS